MSDQPPAAGESSSSTAPPLNTSSRTFRRVPSATSLLPPTSDRGLTASDLIAHQTLLESQAREAIPFSTTTCTYAKGYIRQPLWACKDCGGGAVCAGCSVGCHSDHELVELFAKRGMRCDCGTLSLQRKFNDEERDDVESAGSSSSKRPELKPCNLRAAPLNFAPENDDNVYGKNFEGHFCYCEKGYTYDPMEEEETMFQCLVCEEWLHETCTSLRPRRKAAQTKDQPLATAAIDPQSDSAVATPINPAFEDPPPLIEHEAFDSHICDPCVRKHPILHHYVGTRSAWGACLQLSTGTEATEGSGTVVEVDVGLDKRVQYLILGLSASQEYVQGPQPATSSLKRGLSPIGEGEESEDTSNKRTKLDNADEGPPDVSSIPTPTAQAEQTVKAEANAKQESVEGSSCTLPSIHPLVTQLLALPADTQVGSNPNNADNAQRSSHRLDLFLDEGNSDGAEETVLPSKGFRSQICRCPSCLDAFKDLPFLLYEEETYSPPASLNQDSEDATSTSSRSTYDLGLDALNTLPRAQTLEALQGYGRLRSALFEHLRGFAESGRLVDEESIKGFFEEMRRRDREEGRGG